MNIPVMIDSDNFGRYTAMAAAKSVAGFSSLELIKAHSRASGFFVCIAQTRPNYGDLGGEAFGLAGFFGVRSANPAQVTTSCLAAACGDGSKITKEAAIMATTPTISTPELFISNGQVVTSSLAVADYFTKRHADVIRKIESLECSVEFRQRNFASAEYTDEQGKRRPAYHVTRDGFAFLAMGFTGKRAAQFKEAYITAFNQMEKSLTGTVGTASAAHNAHVVYLYMTEIHRVWMAQLHPMLKSANSPIAVSLYDYINDGLLVSGLVDLSLNEASKEVRK